jgi:hypothetical protein
MRESGNEKVAVHEKYQAHDRWQQDWEGKEQFRAHGQFPIIPRFQ